MQTSGAAAGADEDGSIPDGLDLSELADVLVEAGAVNAVNLVGGGPAAMTVNGSAVIDPAEGCSDSGSGGFGDGSILPRCERAVSSIICVHLDPPPVIAGDEGDTSSSADSPAPGGGSDGGGSASDDGAAGGDDWRGSWSDDYAGGGGDDDVRLQWENDLCGNGTRNGTELWRHMDDVEEAVLRYKVRAGDFSFLFFFDVSLLVSSAVNGAIVFRKAGGGGGRSVLYWRYEPKNSCEVDCVNQRYGASGEGACNHEKTVEGAVDWWLC